MAILLCVHAQNQKMIIYTNPGKEGISSFHVANNVLASLAGIWLDGAQKTALVASNCRFSLKLYRSQWANTVPYLLKKGTF